MKQMITSETIAGFHQQLENHPVYALMTDLEDLQCFMQHHIYSVWDFMSLIKYLQSVIAPANSPWVPQGDASVRRFINELVLEEESDETHIEGEFSSHFELYIRAMKEIGADTDDIERFIRIVSDKGIEQALQSDAIPVASRGFTTTTFQFIQSDRAHEVAAALALGREHIIPGIFRTILKQTGVSSEDAPIFHFYLNRHVHLDEDFHAPLSLRLLNQLCGNDTTRIEQAIQAAGKAVEARLAFWDGVADAITQQRLKKSA